MREIIIADLDKLYYAKFQSEGVSGKMIVNENYSNKKVIKYVEKLLSINPKKSKVSYIMNLGADTTEDINYLVEAMSDFLNRHILFMDYCPDGYPYTEYFYRLKDIIPSIEYDIYVVKNLKSIMAITLLKPKYYKSTMFKK